jgi:hypothetical protein
MTNFIDVILVRGVIHLVLQASPCNLKSDQVEQILRDSVCKNFI